MDIAFIQDTICAIATPPGEGGIGIIRISGPDALAICRNLFHARSHPQTLQSHRLYYGWIRDPVSGRAVDEVLVSYLAAPRTYTREDIVEINCHSGYAVLQTILELVLREGARLAQPGEFTRRAFLNGRIDLSQAEAIAEVIHSRCQKSLELANRHLQGALRDKITLWKETLLQLEAEAEAAIDFSEDLEDEPVDHGETAVELGQGLLHSIAEVLREHERGRLLREGLTLVLVGKPNAGKSSLLNALIGKDRAIVTPFPGTTRDVIEDSFVLGGVRVRVLDTAGIREGSDDIETLGIERTLASVQEADVILWVLDRSRPLDQQDDLVFQSVGDREWCVLLNKDDLEPRFSVQDVLEKYSPPRPPLLLSTLDPAHVERLRGLLMEEFLQKPLEGFESMIAPNVRQKECLERAHEAIRRALDLQREGAFGELVILELEAARKQLDEILGHQGGEDILDRIFSQFCIGK